MNSETPADSKNLCLYCGDALEAPHCFVLQAANQAEAFNLVHPHDRNGKPIADRHCTREVEEALNDYRAACDTARAAVRGQLRLLAETLQVLSTPIPCAVSHKSF